MSRFAVLVDAGYLLSQSVQILSDGRSKSRKEVSISDPQGLIKKLVEHAAAALGNQVLLRVYWYDGVFGKPSSEQDALSLLPDCQLRQGIVNRSGVQKGVDSKIMGDLIELSANHAISDVALVTGDGDLVIAIELAQKHGVRVAVLGIEDAERGISHNQGFEVVCIADRVRRIPRSDISPFLSFNPVPAAASEATKVPPVPAVKRAAKTTPAKKAALSEKKAKAPAKAPTQTPKVAPAVADDVLSGIADGFIAAAVPPFDASTVTPTGAIGQAVDGKLLLFATAALGRKPMPAERTRLREIFRKRLIARLS